MHYGLVLILFGLLSLGVNRIAQGIDGINQGEEKGKVIGQLICLLGFAIDLVSLASYGLNVATYYKLPFGEDLYLITRGSSKIVFVFCLAILTMGLLGTVYATNQGKKYEVSASTIYLGSGISCLLAGDWLSLIIFWEMMAISSAYLVWCGGTKESRGATLRYLLYHFLSGNLFMAGGFWLWYSGGQEIYQLTLDSPGSYLLVAGILINCGMPPLGTWVADGYSAASAYSNIFMATCTTKVSSGILLYFFSGEECLVYMGVIMAVYGAIMALMENNIRKLLSYHIVSQLGMIVTAIGVGTSLAQEGAVLHAVFNIIFKGVLLMCAGSIFKVTGKKYLHQLSGFSMWKKMPFIFPCFFLCSIAIAGIPPLNGFVSKGLILEALHEGGYTFAYYGVVLGGIGTCLSITFKINWFGFVKGSKKSHVDVASQMECSVEEYCNQDASMEVGRLPINMKVAMALGTSLCIFTGIYPRFSLELLGDSQTHIYTAHNIGEYLGLVPAALLVFYLFRKKLEPHPGINLDFDWLLRVPFTRAVLGFAHMVAVFFGRCQELSFDVAKNLNKLVFVPDFILGRESFEERRVRVATGVGKRETIAPLGRIVDVMIVFFIVAFVVMEMIY